MKIVPPAGSSRFLLRSAFAAVSILPIAHAASSWTGAVDNNYNTAGNWTPSGMPGVATDVEILSGTANVPSGNWDRRGAGYTTIGGSAAVTLTAGSARFLNTGAFNMTGGSFTQNGEYFIVGAGAVGTMTHSAGTITTTLSRGFQLSDNGINQSGSTYNLSGTASLSVTSAATFVDIGLRGVWLGKGGESGGDASVPIGTATGDIFNATGGTAVFTKGGTNPAEVRISRNSGLIVNGGAVTFNNYTDFRVGHGASGGLNDRVVVSAGTLDINGGTNMYIGESDAGLLSISGGTMTLNGLLSLGRAAYTGIGTIQMSGGVLNANSIVAVNGNFNFNGGDVYLNGDQTAILGQTWFHGAAGTTASFDGSKTHLFIVPEPSLGLLLLGATGLAGIRRRRC